MRTNSRTIDLRWMAASALTLCLLSAAAPAQSWLNSPISHTQPGEAANAGNGLPQITANERYVAFNSSASNLVAGQIDANEIDVFLFDRQTSTMTLVSHAADNPLRSSSPGFSQVKAIANSGAVLFDSSAPHLIAGETAGYVMNSFVHFPFDGSNRLISREAGTSARSNGECRGRALDASTQFAVIACTGTNLQVGISDSNAGHDLYFSRLGANTNSLITHTAASLTTAADVGVDAFNGRAMVTAFGNYVAFTSAATNMVTGQSDSNNAQDVFLYESATGNVRLVSHIAGNLATSGASGATLVALDGSYVIFNSSNANHIVGGTDTNAASDVFSYEIATGAITLISHVAGMNTTAPNGSSAAAVGTSTEHVLFETTASISNALTGPLTRDVMFWHRSSGLFQLVSHAHSGPLARANAPARVATTNVVGQRAVFETTATDIVPGFIASLTNASNLYVYDLPSASNRLLTHRDGQPTVGSARAVDPSSVQFADAGDIIVLSSPAGDLSSSIDGNAVHDIYAYSQLATTSSLISKAAFADPASADRATTPVDISGDGRYVLQTSNASNLGFDQIEAGNDSDVFIYDHATGTQTLLSYAIEGFEVLTNVPANAPATAKAISRDGAYVLFSSAATNLLAFQNDTNAAVDVFLKDHIGGGIELVSHASVGNNVAGNAAASAVAVSATGRYVLYDSNASNAVAGITDTNAVSDVFLFDRLAGTSVIVSKASGAATSANERSQAIALSPDGRYVLYHSRATNLIAGFVNLNGGADDVWLYDRTTATSRLISREVGSAVRGANGGANATGLSDDGDRIVYVSSANNLIPGGIVNVQANVYVHQVSTTTTRLVSHNGSSETAYPNNASSPIAISGDGSTVLFASYATDLPASGSIDNNGPTATDLFIYDTATRVNTLLSRSHLAEFQGSNREWRDPRMNADGSRIVFATLASDVINGINNGAFFQQVYQYDRANASFSLISHRDTGALEANNNSSNAFLSANGDRVAFASNATNLAAWTDINGAGDSFIAQRVNGYVITPVINGNGSIDPSGPQTVAIGGTIVFTLTPGVGQQIASANGCGGALVGNQFTTAAAAADCTVTFNFTPLQFTLQYLAAANGSIAGDANQTVDYGGSGSEVQAVPNVGYDFDRWSDDRPGNGRTDSNVTANLSVTASFTIQRFNLLYSAGAGGTIDGQPNQLFTVDYGSDGPTVTAMPNAGQVFVSWSDGVLTAQRSDLDVVAHLTVQAQFAENAQMTVTPIVGANGSANPNTPQSVAPGGTTFFDLTPNVGYRIGAVGGCNGSLVGNRYTTGAVNQNCNVSFAFNRTPTAQDGSLDAVEDGGSYGGTINAIDDDAYTIAVVTQPAKGSLIMQASGQYFYAPNENANGADSFTFKINDGVQDSNTATVSIAIAAVNDPPSFALNPEIVPEHAAGTSGAQTRNEVLSAIDFGPPDEDASQNIAGVQAFEIFDPANILSAVSISNAGVLSYTLSGAAGLARVNVSITDSGGTANGGNATSDSRQLTISVRNASDLQVSDSNGAASVAPGQAVVYEVLVANAGPYAVSDAQLSVPVPAGFSNVLWSCNSIQLASCPQANGAGAIAALALTLPNNGVLRFLVSGTVTAAAGATLSHNASVTIGGGMFEIDAGNNTATDADPVAAQGITIFGNGFEGVANRFTYPLPPGSTLYPVPVAD